MPCRADAAAAALHATVQHPAPGSAPTLQGSCSRHSAAVCANLLSVELGTSPVRRAPAAAAPQLSPAPSSLLPPPTCSSPQVPFPFHLLTPQSSHPTASSRHPHRRFCCCSGREGGAGAPGAQAQQALAQKFGIVSPSAVPLPPSPPPPPQPGRRLLRPLCAPHSRCSFPIPHPHRPHPHY